MMVKDMGSGWGEGKLWDRQSLRGIVNNPILYGQPYANRYMPVKKKTFENGKYSHMEKIRPCEDWIPLPPCDPVITRETFDLIQFQIEANKIESIRNNHLNDPGLARAEYIFCSICGRSMSQRPPSPSSHYSINFYECRKKTGKTPDIIHNHRINISMRTIDNSVKAKIAESLSHPELIRARVDELRSQRKPVVDVESIYATIKDI